MVLLFGFPESPFAQPRNVFFGHLVTTLVGVIFVNLIPLPIFISIAVAVGIGIFFMILLNVVHPPAGVIPPFMHLDVNVIDQIKDQVENDVIDKIKQVPIQKLLGR